ncbi:MAG: 50S ribosomal protein L9 [Candidatus Omnitrophica bacterium]|nr:50S ribosomal protein L9 [Candidatus Omnitrophota bacterium]
MKIILTKDVEKLGKEGDVIEVKEGFARNFLLPQGSAIKATKNSFKEIEELKKRKDKQDEKIKNEAAQFKTKIEALSLTIIAEAKDTEELYGSVTEQQILKALKDEGLTLDKGKIAIPEQIKKLGVYNLKVKLHPAVEANLRLWVMKK